MCRVLEPNVPQVKPIHLFVQVTNSLLRVCSSCWDDRQEKSVSPGLQRADHLFKGKNKQVRSPRYADDATLRAENKQELKSLLMKVNEENEKPGLKFNIQKLRSWHPVPSLHGKQMGKQWKQRQTSFSWASKSLRTLTATKKLKDTSNFSSPWKKSYDRPR